MKAAQEVFKRFIVQRKAGALDDPFQTVTHYDSVIVQPVRHLVDVGAEHIDVDMAEEPAKVDHVALVFNLSF